MPLATSGTLIGSLLIDLELGHVWVGKDFLWEVIPRSLLWVPRSEAGKGADGESRVEEGVTALNIDSALPGTQEGYTGQPRIVLHGAFTQPTADCRLLLEMNPLVLLDCPKRC